MQINQSLTVKQLTSDALGTFRGTPEALIGLVQKATIDRMGGIPEFRSSDEEAVFFAGIDHQTALVLSGLSERSSQAHRRMIWDVYKSGRFLNVRLPIVDPATGQPILKSDGTPEFHRFPSFEEWYEYLCETSKLDATIASVVYNATTRLLPAVDTGRIDAEFEEFKGDLRRTVVQTITPDHIFQIERSKLETIMSPVRKLLSEYDDTGDETVLRTVGEIIEKSLTLSRKELKRWLAGEGHSGTKVGLIDAHIAEIGDGKAVMTLILDAAQRRYIDGIIGARLNEFPETMDQLMTTLAQLVERPIEHEELNEDDLLAELS